MLATAHAEPYESLDGFLEQNLGKELLRFTTAGSVDDGKSTLIGRLLHESAAVYEDQLTAIKKSRLNRSTGAIDFSLLTDGLRAEPLFQHGQAKIHHRGYAGTRTIHAKHGHGSIDG